MIDVRGTGGHELVLGHEYDGTGVWGMNMIVLGVGHEDGGTGVGV